MAVKPRRVFRDRSKSTLIVKDRDVSTCLGESNDALYYASSSSTGYLDDAKKANFRNEDYVLSSYNDGMEKRTTPIIVPKTFGKENISYQRGNPIRCNKDYRFCLHVKNRYVNLPYYIAHLQYNSGTTGYVQPYARSAFGPGAIVPINRTLLNKSFEKDRDFSLRAWKTMQPRFEGDVSLINFIWELKDFTKYVRLLCNLDNIFHKSAPLLKKIQKAVVQASPVIDTKKHVISPKGVEHTLKDPTKLAAEMNLWWQYEVKPTLMDISDISTQIALSAQTAQDKYIAQGKNGLTRHYSETEVLHGSTQGTLNYFRYATGLETSITRVAEYQFTYDYQIRKGMDLIKQYWGLNLTAEAAWNALPLSFLADYAFTVGKTLHMLRADKNTSVHLGLYGESVKFLQTQGTHLVLEPRTLAIVVDGQYYQPRSDARRVLISGHEFSHYKRSVADPVKYGVVFPRSKRISGQHLFNMAALARCFFN